jgi:hypothetical protein
MIVVEILGLDDWRLLPLPPELVNSQQELLMDGCAGYSVAGRPIAHAAQRIMMDHGQVANDLFC